MRDAVFTLIVCALLGLTLFRPFVGVILWSWISFMSPQVVLWGFAGALPWGTLVFGATLAGCVIAREPRRLALNGVTSLALVFLVGVTLTSLLAPGNPQMTWNYWDRVMKIILGLLVTSALLTDRRRVHALVWIMVISIGFYSVKGGLATLASGGSFRIYGPENTMIADNNHLAVGMLVAMPLMNYLRLHSRHRVVRFGLLMAMVLTLFAVVGSYSRGALLSLCACVMVLWWRSHRKLASAVVLLGALAVAITFMPDQWVERMQTLRTHQEDASASDRLVLWGIAWKLALAHPLTGVGFTGGYQPAVVNLVEPGGLARAVHSIWFMVLGEHGFVLFFVWLGMTAAGAWYAQRLVKLARGRPELAWAYDMARMAQVSIVAYLVGGTFLSLAYWDFYWTLLVMVAATHRLALRSQAARRASAAPDPASDQAPEAAPDRTPEPVAAAGGWRPAVPRQRMLRT